MREKETGNKDYEESLESVNQKGVYLFDIILGI
jgi:hypothetical protein